MDWLNSQYLNNNQQTTIMPCERSTTIISSSIFCAGSLGVWKEDEPWSALGFSFVSWGISWASGPNIFTKMALLYLPLLGTLCIFPFRWLQVCCNSSPTGIVICNQATLFLAVASLEAQGGSDAYPCGSLNPKCFQFVSAAVTAGSGGSALPLREPQPLLSLGRTCPQSCRIIIVR